MSNTPSPEPFVVRQFHAAGGYSRWDVIDTRPEPHSGLVGSRATQEQAEALAAQMNADEARFQEALRQFREEQDDTAAAQRREDRRAARDAWNRDHPEPWHGADRDRDYWEPQPWEQGR